MQAARIVALALLGLFATGTQAAAETYEGPSAYRTAVFWNPAERLWTGGLAPDGCTAAGHRAPMAAAKVRTAVYQQRGELIGEIRALPAQAPLVIAQAHSCATEADSATTTYALLTEADRNWSLFRKAFSACMSRTNQAQYVGSMTLWIDQRCDW
ncbi:hypothetical protein [Phenylobacterium soli]|uniref:DUF1311 domain-containing protein n=1 Tax=Phenylobacterium soli TaxID=2170551 RepID=A0A328AK85_9CAUL|nr:hypothetical protein [Phenylobacterium soli]RAK54881.1 hypothetical protein DJ017_10260 [Phenylobacterium soli]